MMMFFLHNGLICSRVINGVDAIGLDGNHQLGQISRTLADAKTVVHKNLK